MHTRSFLFANIKRTFLFPPPVLGSDCAWNSSFNGAIRAHRVVYFGLKSTSVKSFSKLLAKPREMDTIMIPTNLPFRKACSDRHTIYIYVK